MTNLADNQADTVHGDAASDRVMDDEEQQAAREQQDRSGLEVREGLPHR